MQTHLNLTKPNHLSPSAPGLGFYSVNTVCELTGFSRQHIYRLERLGKFPRRRKLGLAKVGFVRAEIHAWIETRPKPDLPAEDDA